MIEAVGGASQSVCASFLSELEDYDENIGLVAKVNTQTHRCFLVPGHSFLRSQLIIKISNLLDHPALCQLADQETPTAVSANLGVTEAQGPMLDDEIENYNDISSITKQIHYVELT